VRLKLSVELPPSNLQLPPGQLAPSEEKGGKLSFNLRTIPPITKLNWMGLFQRHERKEEALFTLRLKPGFPSFKHIELLCFAPAQKRFLLTLGNLA
jgi:hypothetical protein